MKASLYSQAVATGIVGLFVASSLACGASDVVRDYVYSVPVPTTAPGQASPTGLRQWPAQPDLFAH